MASAPLESKQHSMKEEPRFGLWEDRRFIAIIITVAVAFLCLGVPLVRPIPPCELQSSLEKICSSGFLRYPEFWLL
jgi:hypothetical protein